ncbi:hypothetical protein D3869_01285 [Azospirillum brasilense]|uniref:Uncharacterized protein n=1 Tax=Azospirillum brasilense TaxID=192 RepID=A0A4D8QZX8_AZOBR|nr:hypothetical protein [Azospirillum brasilense]QCO13973.1 hypothetical protein D3869_01285 [Azospirillum brasilense]
MRSTMIASLNLTFRDAVDRCLDLIAQQNSTPTDTEEGEARADAIAVQWLRLADKLLSAVPVTMADGAAIADLLLDDCAGLPNAGVHGPKLAALVHLRNLLARQVEQLDDGADCGPFLADVRRWLELEATIGAEGQDDADLIDSSEEAYRLALKIAAYDGNPTLAMAAKALLLWAEHPVACHPDSRPGALPFPPPVSAAQKEEDALIFGLVTDALRAVPELKALLTGEAAVANEADDFGAAIASLADRAIPHTAPTVPTAITDAMVEAGANAAGCSPDAFRAGFTAALKMMEAA